MHDMIQVGRAIDAVPATVSAGATSTTPILTGDSNRVGVSVSIGDIATMLATESITVVARQGGTNVPIWTLTADHPSVYLAFEKFGSLVTGPLSVHNFGASAQTLGVIAYRLIRPIEDD